MFVVDSNILIRFTNGELSIEQKAWFENRLRANDLQISTITRTEFLAKPSMTDAIDIIYKDFLDKFITLPLTYLIADLAGYLRSRFGLLLGDSIVAATALFYDLPVVTADGRGFHKVTGLKVLRPEEL